MDRAQENTEKQPEHYHIADHENRILSKYFQSVLADTKHYWSPEVESVVSSNALQNPSYESTVSSGVITRFSQKQVLSFFTVIIVFMILLGKHSSRLSRADRSNEDE